MGFKFKRVDLLAGSEDFPIGSTNTYALKVQRSKIILTKCAEAIINCGCGWQLDTTKSTTLTDYTMVNTRASSTDTYPALFLVNSTSGCKLFMAYFATEPNWGIPDFSGNGSSIINVSYNGAAYCTGLCMSMIPSGSTNTFGSISSTSFIPADATRIVGTHTYYTNDTNPYCCFGGNPTSNYVYSWGLFVTPETIAVSCTKNNATQGHFGVPVFAIGKIIDTLAHSADDLYTARYGCLLFRKSGDNTSDNEGMTPVISCTYNLYGDAYGGGSPCSFYGLDPNGEVGSDYLGYNKCCGAITKYDGTWINGTNSQNHGVTVYPLDVFQMSNFVHSSTSGESRWSPFVIRCVTANLGTYGVYNGDGMKGYLDTSLFRNAKVSLNQTYADGAFIGADETYHLMLGWDATNTDSL